MFLAPSRNTSDRLYPRQRLKVPRRHSRKLSNFCARLSPLLSPCWSKREREREVQKQRVGRRERKRRGDVKAINDLMTLDLVTLDFLNKTNLARVWGVACNVSRFTITFPPRRRNDSREWKVQDFLCGIFYRRNTSASRSKCLPFWTYDFLDDFLHIMSTFFEFFPLSTYVWFRCKLYSVFAGI